MSDAREPTEDRLPGGLTLGERVAEGSTAEVFRATHPRLGRELAVKLLRPSIDPAGPLGRRLQREGQLLARLSHQHVPQLFDQGTLGGRPYLVLEWLDGPSLRALLDKARGPLPPAVALAVGVQLAQALEAVHRLGLVHADVKPANVLLTAQGVLKLADFGLARAGSAEDEALAGTGTPAYMSPEQILGDRLDARSDLFAFGIVLYECLAGRRPFEQDPARTVMQKIRLDRYTPAGSLAPGVPAAADRILARCLSKAPSHRYANAGALAQDLLLLWPSQSALTPEAVLRRHLAPEARPTGRAERREAERPRSLPALPPAVYLVAQGLLGLGAALLGSLGTPARPASGASASPQQVGPRPPGAPDVGLLRVVAHPWAQLTIDGVVADTTPTAQAFRLTPGVHYVRFENPAYLPEDRAVRIERGGTLWLDVNLSPRPGGARPDAGAPGP